MNSVCRDIFTAIHSRKWLSIEYQNSKKEITKYWIGIKSINPIDKSMRVIGLHLGLYTTTELKIFVESILSSSVIEGSYFDTDTELIEDIKLHPIKYQSMFHKVANLKILNYLIECNKLDALPYKTDYALINHFDGEWKGKYKLSDEQFKEIVKNFQYSSTKKNNTYKIKSLAVNVMSINTEQGLYVLAYRRLYLNVVARTLEQDDEITVCTEYSIDGNKQSVRKFLDAEDYDLLEDFEKNIELIKDKITTTNRHIKGVDDMPYMIAIGRDIILDLNQEYKAIHKMYEEDKVTTPIKAFFGELLKPVWRKKDYPIVLMNKQINLDQLLAIHNGMKYPLAYIQGPPGTGKTNTIVNAIITAFFNEKTVLFTSYNNHPIDGVFNKLANIEYKNNYVIPFPIIRLGNDEKVLEALDYIKTLYNRTKDLNIFEATLDKNKNDKIERTKKLSQLLKNHEEKLELLERKETIEKLLSTNNHLSLHAGLQGAQLFKINEKLKEIGDVTNEEAIKLVMEDAKEFEMYLYYTSAKYIKRLKEAKNQDLMDIVNHGDAGEKVKKFNEYIKKPENLKKFQRIFPIIATTAISSHKLGEPDTYFDMVIMDEASQGNIATSLVPILRGNNLMLVGDPQQLNPVILLDSLDNAKLRKIYNITDEYDYVKNSIYKTFLASDAVSGEILLSRHYRCHKDIINFNNKKYYNNKLIVETQSNEKNPLVFVNVANNTTNYKNTAPYEAEEIVEFARLNKDKSIGVITPFVNQKQLIDNMLKEKGITNVGCGTVHAFQGDEKDVILFSLSLTDKTGKATYGWLKNNKELINVATSRAKEKLVVVGSDKELERLHDHTDDDLYELVNYIKTQGKCQVTPRETSSRALGVKPYSTETETAFFETLNHALDNVLNTNQKCVVRKEVGISHVFQDTEEYNALFYTGRFDFVVYEKYQKMEIPILAIELDGREHIEDEIVKERDRRKAEICRQHKFELIRVENSYARRYQHIKAILEKYFMTVK